jgi:UDP-glucose 4-epimerase
MSKCLVTGGAGFIGSHVVDILISRGHSVTVVDDFSTGAYENINSSIDDLITGKVQDQETWELARSQGNFEFVFHLAALARIQPSIDDPITSNDANVVGTLHVLEHCRQTGAKVIFSGSSSIYEGENLPTREADPKKPKSPYAMQKLMCEQYIRLYKELYGVEYAILRYFNVYGERQILHGAYAAVVGILLKAKQDTKKLPVTSDGEQRRDFTYVKDVAYANLLAMDWQGTFNIGTGKNYSINDLAEHIGGEIEYIGERRGESRATLANNSKAKKHGWEPKTSIEDWIHAYPKL